MLFDVTAEDAVTGSESAVKASLNFDWDSGAYAISRGSPAKITGLEAVKGWLQLVLRTPRGRYAVYPAGFGASLYQLIGKKLPRGAELAELRRQLQESAAWLPAIASIGAVTWDGEKISCTVTLDLDGEKTEEVIELES